MTATAKKILRNTTPQSCADHVVQSWTNRIASRVVRPKY